MAEYDNSNSGVLFQNKKSRDTQPDYTGKLSITAKQFKKNSDGSVTVDIRLAGWVKTSDRVEGPFLSLKANQPEERDL